MSARVALRNVLRIRAAISQGVVAGVVLSLASFASTGGGILTHTTCEVGSRVAYPNDTWIPAVLVNSPFGGNASGMGIMNWDFPGAWNGPPPAPGQTLKVGMGTGDLNGTAGGAFFTVSLSVFQSRTVTQAGPGMNLPCTASVQLDLQAPQTYAEAGARVTTVSNLTDAGEADNATLFAGLNGSIQSPAFFDNGFTRANTNEISTCGQQGKTVPAAMQGLGVTFHVAAINQTYLIPETLPFTEVFSYTFPGDFGNWQVDNLSEPGGPGGGWAFSYSPCA
jgi:hypothetical protein